MDGRMANDLFNLRTRAAMLEGQEQAARAELSKIRQIPCPECNGKMQISEPGLNADTVSYRQCDVCGGNGKAIAGNFY